VRQAIRYYVRTDLNSKSAVDNALAKIMEAKTASGSPPRFDVVESHNEIWLELEAHINQTLNVPGIRPQDLEPLKKKSAMKRKFAACDLTTARGQRVTDPAQGLELAQEVGFPLILKPDEGVGAGSIHKVTHQVQLEAILPRLAGDYFMEEFVEAPIVSFDGLVDYQGNLLFENSLAYGHGVLEYVLGKDTFFYVTRAIPQALREIGRRLVKAFDIRRKFFHFEFFFLNGAYLPIEINCRPPGGAILDMMNYSVDDDLYGAYARMITGSDTTAPAWEKKYYCAYVGRRDRDYFYPHHELVQRLGPALVEFGENPGIFQQAMSRFRYIIRSANRERLMEMARDIQRFRE
jgi:biotin carboxylase